MGSTNKTTHYELSQYVGSDKPTYLVDYNQDMSTIDSSIYAAKEEADLNKGAIGTLSNLTTTVKTDLVNAVNEVNSYTSSIGVLSDLTTTAKTSCVAAINEVNGKASDVGSLTDLTTTAKTSAVAAINEVNGNVGALANLTTTAKTSAVAAINELDSDLGTQASSIGDLTNLSTTVKTDLVSAINEVNNLIEELDNYSTSETDTGKKWIDNKTIYRKCFTANTLANPIPVNISNLADVVTMSCLIKENTGAWRNLPWLYPGGSSDWVASFYLYNGNINFQAGSSIENSTDEVVFILEYTKSSV